jgi:hypothetical protein
MQEINETLFYENLKLSQIYCEQQLLNCDKNTASIFRSINPIINGRNIFEFKISDYGFAPKTRYCFSTEWTQDPLRNGNALYNELFDLQLLKKRDHLGKTLSNKEYNGRILVAQIDCTVTDGASEVSSMGLIDVYDCPPIDTWFYLLDNINERLLFAWIPNEFVYDANQAIEVNCVDCLSWFDEKEPQNKFSKVAQQPDNNPKSFYDIIRKYFK